MKGIGLSHLIKTPLNKYIFDANRNVLIKDDYGLTECIKDNAPVLESTKRFFCRLNENGYLLDQYPTTVEHNESENIIYHLQHKVNSITLQLTQKCNFRCTYCIYSEDSSPYQRNHSDVEMTTESAEKAVDFLFSHSRDINSVNIGFYGGEPLLRYDLIRHVVKYVSEKYYGKKITYSITTNGSLLTDEMVEFFIEHEIYPMISFDGPREIHDKYRRFAHNGKGTYEVVVNKLKHISIKFPEFFRKLRFSTVVDPLNDLQCVNNTLSVYHQNYNISSLISLLSDSYGPSQSYIPESFSIVQNNERIKTFLYILGFVVDGGISPVAVNYIDSICRLASSFRENHSFSLQKSPGGPCIPGTIRLLVSANGTFYPCEHVSERSDVMKIGNLTDGFDVEKVLNLLNVAKITESHCKKCWAYHQCYQCAKFCDNMENLSPEKRLRECYNVRYTVENQLKGYLMLKEMMEMKNGSQTNKERLRLPVQL